MKPMLLRVLTGSILVLSLLANLYWWQKSSSIGRSAHESTAMDQQDRTLSRDRESESQSASPAEVPAWSQLEADLNYLFEGEQYRMALAGISAASPHYPHETRVLITRWFRKSIQALQENSTPTNLHNVEQLLEAASSAYYGSMDYQWLQAEFLIGSGDELEAVDLFIELQRTARGEFRHSINQRIAGFLEDYFEAVYSDLDWDKGLRIVDRLLWHNPNDGESLLLKADLLVQQKRYADAEQPLLTAVTIESHKHKARNMLERVGILKLRDISIPLVPVGRSQFLVEAGITPVQGDREYSGSLLLDTGASLTVLTHQFFKQIAKPGEVRFVSNALMNTAGGQVEAPVYNIARFRVGEYELGDFDVVVMDYPAGQSQGLLGMNFLGRFDFEIDQENEWLTLAPKR